jgi:ribonuclease Z
MHGDHIFGLPTVILHTTTVSKFHGDKEQPLHIYGPFGLYEYICTSLRLSQNTTRRLVIVHEMIISENDARDVYNARGER